MLKLITVIIVGAVVNATVYKLLGFELEDWKVFIYTLSCMSFGAVVYRSVP